MTKVVTIKGIAYRIIRRTPILLGYGTIGSRGIEVFRPGDTSQTSLRFSNMKEFRATVKRWNK
jgi:hypothetical protein